MDSKVPNGRSSQTQKLKISIQKCKHQKIIIKAKWTVKIEREILGDILLFL